MAYFAFTQPDDQEFIFEVTDEAMIAHARKIISGEETKSVHVKGRLLSRQAPYNSDWPYQLDPSSVTFYNRDNANDVSVSHRDAAGRPFVLGYIWRPSNARVTREVYLETEHSFEQAQAA
ncbi:MAG TPA: hypothetical protein VNO30_15210 [Kofleriaceae bacterium]|nr:hypothetical protein [Kofleriaceae bacterium]